MGQNHRGSKWLRLLSAWQLSLSVACLVASKSSLNAGSGIVEQLGKIPANAHNLELYRDVFQLHDQCPKPEPCYRDAESEFCVFAANAKDNMGISKVVPMVTTHGRALKLIHILSETDIPNPERSSKPKYTVRPVSGKGLGIISTTELDRGELILSDLPTLIIDHCMMSTVPQYHLARLMNEAAYRLTSAQLDRLMNLDVLGDEAPDEHYLVGRIYATSAYMLDPDGVLFGGGCGLGALFPESKFKMRTMDRPKRTFT